MFIWDWFTGVLGYLGKLHSNYINYNRRKEEKSNYVLLSTYFSLWFGSCCVRFCYGSGYRRRCLFTRKRRKQTQKYNFIELTLPRQIAIVSSSWSSVSFLAAHACAYVDYTHTWPQTIYWAQCTRKRKRESERFVVFFCVFIFSIFVWFCVNMRFSCAVNRGVHIYTLEC